jgi:DNA/RNA-binding domain of Phe-tRNA-synthetase-like protein
LRYNIQKRFTFDEANMVELEYSIAPEVFARFPGYVRGVVLAFGVVNRETPPELTALLRESEAKLREQVKLETISDHPLIHNWREAYRAFGAKPSEFRSSIEALARRALRGEPLPTINALVDIGNVMSLRRLVPTGGHAIDLLKEDITLRPAEGDEVFVPFGSDQPEAPLKGEIIFTEGKTVLCRRWTWRQANESLTLLSTKAIEYNVDGLPPTSEAEVVENCQELMEMIRQYCGGECRFEVLSAAHPKMKLVS